MSKPFAIAPREQFTVLNLILGTKSDTKEERSKRRALWEELGMVEVKRKLLRVTKPKTKAETEAEAAAKAADPDWVDPTGVYVWEWADEDPTVRVGLHGSTIEYLITKLSGPMEGVQGEVLGDLCDRLISLRDTPDAATICTRKGGGYHLPESLWTPAEIAAAAPPPPVADKVAVVDGVDGAPATH